MSLIPVTALVCTRNEEKSIAACLAVLRDFAQIIVIDSGSSDRTCEIARDCGADVVPFNWNGQYPKKRQWCLDHLPLAHDWIFFVDADEIVTLSLLQEIRNLMAAPPACDGYFVKGLYVLQGKILKYGVPNTKLVLFNRHKFFFPVVGDLGCEGMGEMEGHYQPLPIEGARIGHIQQGLLHYAYDGGESWRARHARYMTWERAMNERQAWPIDPVPHRQFLKKIFRAMPCRGFIAFVHAYVLKAGFLDGYAGFVRARDRGFYYRALARKRQ